MQYYSSNGYLWGETSPLLGIGSSHLKTQEIFRSRILTKIDNIPYFTSPQCLTMFWIGPALHSVSCLKHSGLLDQ